MPDAAWHNARNARWLARAKAAFWAWLAAMGRPDPLGDYIRRYCEIRELPDVRFHGRELKRTPPCPRCGQQRNYPEGHLWAVVSIYHVICPWCLLRG